MTRNSKIHILQCLNKTDKSALTFNLDYFKSIWNIIDLVQIGFTVAFIATYLGGNSHYVWLLALSAYVQWIGVLYYLQVSIHLRIKKPPTYI